MCVNSSLLAKPRLTIISFFICFLFKTLFPPDFLAEYWACLEVGGLDPGHREGDGRDPGAGQPVAPRKLHLAHAQRVLVRAEGEALGGRAGLVGGEREEVGRVLRHLVRGEYSAKTFEEKLNFGAENSVINEKFDKYWCFQLFSAQNAYFLFIIIPFSGRILTPAS